MERLKIDLTKKDIIKLNLKEGDEVYLDIIKGRLSLVKYEEILNLYNQ